MITYLLKSATCLALLLAFYHFVLEKEKMHSFNRYYLLGSIFFSFLVPLYIIYIDAAPIVLEATESVINYAPTNVSNTEIVYEEPINYMQIVLILYLLISSVLLIRFGKNLYKIIHKIRKNTKIDFQNAKLVLVDDQILPHTFWNYIFINKNDYENQKIEQELFTHELTHVTQKHTLDVLILELIQIVFWINPFFILLKKAIQLNHEFLADETVINQHKNTFQYQHLLLNKAAWKNEYYLASNLNYSLTKKRLLMMTTQSSHTKILLKKLAVIPLLAGFVFLFAERVEAQEIIEITEEPIQTIVEEVSNESKNLSESESYQQYFHSKTLFMFKDKNGKEISKKYSELTKEEKKRLIPPPPIKTKKKVPTQKLIEDLKDSKKYAIWIDEKVVSNATLNNYKASDFSNFFVSFVYKNARSKRFPQNYQASLSTNKHYENQNKKRAKAFKKYLKEYTESAEVIEIVEEKKANTYTSKNSKQSISKTTASLFEIKPYENINSGFKVINGKVFYFVSINDKIKYYNKEGKLYSKNGKEVSNKKANASDIMPEMYVKKVYYKGNLFCEFIDNKPNLKELEKKAFTQQLKKVINTVNIKNNQKLNKNWFITIDGQKYYYTFDKNERVARYYKNGKLANLDIVKEYKKKHKIFEKLKASGKHYVYKPDNDQKEIDREFSDLGGIYFRMSRVDKNKVKYPENPIKPYVKLRKGDKIWYKKRAELTEEEKLLLPPPPPVPNATKEQILEARKAYDEWKKRMGNDLPPPPKPKKN